MGTPKNLIVLSALVSSCLVVSIASAGQTAGGVITTQTPVYDYPQTTPSPTPTSTYNRTVNTGGGNETLVSQYSYTLPTAETITQLYTCFNSGQCKESASSAVLYRYPIRCNGSGTSDCSGCYTMAAGKLTRVSDLDSAGNCASASSTAVDTNPGQSGTSQPKKIKIFVGYQMRCPNGANASGFCDDGELYLNCKISGLDSQTFEPNSVGQYERECFANSPYIKRQPASGVTTAGAPACASTCTALAGNYCTNQTFYDLCGNQCTGTMAPSACGS